MELLTTKVKAGYSGTFAIVISFILLKTLKFKVTLNVPSHLICIE